ncbi:MAG: BufA1 family periplasmic bufferin-type metallophore [Gammaproteobacteria bacterium]
MDKQSLVIKSAVAALFAAGAFVAVQSASAGSMKDQSMMKGQSDHMMAKTVKCYGVNAAHKNDCQSPGHSCAGLDKKARDANAFVEMPAGLCEKIAGGSTTKGEKSMMGHKG